MRYTKKEDKDQIRVALYMLFAEFKTNLSKFCDEYGYTYHTIYQRLNNNSINHDFVNEMIHKLDKKRTLQRNNNKLVISRTF